MRVLAIRQSRGRNAGRFVVAAALGIGLLTAPAADAAPLGLTPTTPDITASLDVAYAAGVLTAGLSDGVGQFAPGGLPVTDLTYSLSANVDSGGGFSGGSFSIFGEIPSLGVGPSILLAGNLTAFGWLFDASSPGFGLFEFLFDTTSSAAALGFGPQGGIIISSLDLSGGDFTQAFRGTATSDTFTSVPEPAMLTLLALGSAGLAARRRYVAHRSR